MQFVKKNVLLVVLSVAVVLAVSSTASAIEERMKEHCDEYAKTVFEIIPDPVLIEGAEPKKRDTCRISSQTTILGGEEASPKEFPHMALIGYGDYPISWRCGGSLISDQWVLTAAHCTAAPDNKLAKYVLLGDLDVLSTEDDENDSARPRIYKIIQRVNHPGYRKPLVYNDIALYKLNETVELNAFVRPICLHSPLSASNKTVLASGWGATLYNGSASSHLLKVGLDIVDNQQCNKKYPQSEETVHRKLAEGIHSSSQICAWADGKDTCQGDSGGPIQQVLKEPYCMYSLIGVTSVGNKCGSQIPSIYTHVHYYLSWVESVVWPQSKRE